MLANLLLGLVIFLLVLLVGGFTLPDFARAQRQIVINAAPETVFALIGDFNAWSRWSPWAEKDPEAKVEIEGEGRGAVMRWKSEKESVGVGSQTVTVYDAPRFMETKLEFEGRGCGVARLRVEPEGDGASKVTWDFETHMRDGAPTHMKPMATYFGYFMDAMLGADYEKGLATLKRIAESAPAPAPTAATPEVPTTPARTAEEQPAIAKADV